MTTPASIPDASQAPDESTPANRREFLQRLAVAGSVAAGAVLASGCASATALASTTAKPATPRAQATQWDMSWREKLGRYRTAYDSPEINGGAALQYALSAASGYKDAYNSPPGEFTPVLILRHAASVMVLNDAMWNKLALGEPQKLKDPTTGEPTMRNPFINYTAGDKYTMIGKEGGIDTLMKAGAIVLTCNRALSGIAYQLRRKDTTLTQEAAMAEIRAAVLPGVYVMPNGIFAVSAAQDAGCGFMRA